MAPVTKGNCEFCGDAVLEIETAAVPVTGWVSERKAGGANQILDKHVIRGRVAHATCVKQQAAKKKRGIADSQLSF